MLHQNVSGSMDISIHIFQTTCITPECLASLDIVIDQTTSSTCSGGIFFPNKVDSSSSAGSLREQSRLELIVSPTKQILDRCLTDVSVLLLDHILRLKVGEQDSLKVVYQHPDCIVVEMVPRVLDPLPEVVGLPGPISDAILSITSNLSIGPLHLLEFRND